MDFLQKTALLLDSMVRLAVKAGYDPNSAKYIANQVLNNCQLKLETDSEFKKKAIEEPQYFKNYIQRSMVNAIITDKKWRKDHPRFKENKYGEVINVPPDKSEIEDTVEKEQRLAVMRDFIKKLSEVCDEREKKFLDLLLELTKESGKSNVSKAGRMMGMEEDESHNLVRRIGRKAAKLEAKQGMLEDIGTAQAIIDLGLYPFFSDLFYEKAEDKPTPGSMEMARSYISKLSLSQIDLLSKAFY